MARRTFCRMLGSLLVVAALCLAAGASQVTAQFAALGGESQNGIYTYPYYITIDNAPWNPMVCDDYYHHSSVGDTWFAKITPLTSSDLSNTRFNDAQLYGQAGFLLLQIKPDNQPEWGNINFAIWETFNPGVDPGTTPAGTLGAAYWLDLSRNADLSTVNLNSVMILTPLNPHSPEGDQEFLYTTPEPGTLLLTGSALLGLFSQRRRFTMFLK